MPETNRLRLMQSLKRLTQNSISNFRLSKMILPEDRADFYAVRLLRDMCSDDEGAMHFPSRGD